MRALESIWGHVGILPIDPGPNHNQDLAPNQSTRNSRWLDRYHYDEKLGLQDTVAVIRK